MLGRLRAYLAPLAVAPLAIATMAVCTVAAAQGLNGGLGQSGTTGLNTGGQSAFGGQGGGQDYDYDSLIDLIQSTVASETWAENGGGEAEIRPFVGGVYVDAQGTLRQATATDAGPERAALAKDLDRLKERAASATAASDADARTSSGLRCVSLPRLEREIARRINDKLPLDEAMLTLAGLQRVEYVFVYPDSGDIALAGPAGDWRLSDERRLVSTESGLPVVRLDDLLTLMRRDPASPFGCTIDPRPDALAKAQAYINEHPIPSSKRGRERWLEQVRGQVGLQDLTYLGAPGDTRVACVLGEADYHMKLIGMGLADGTAGMKSYLQSIRVKPGGSAPGVGAVRWWFAMNYQGVEQSESGAAFHLVGQGVKVLSENEAIAARGQRVPTGQSDEFSQEFASSFTANFEALCQKYPVYAELRNVFDLALVTALIDANGLLEKSGWRPELLTSASGLPLPRYRAPNVVDTVANLRVIGGRHVVAGVSGGVWARPTEVLAKQSLAPSSDGPMRYEPSAAPEEPGAWWWDAR